MGLLDWLFKKKNFKRAEDAFALNREILSGGLKQRITLAQTQGRATWLIVHFTDTFTEVQKWLERWRLDYEIVSTKLTANNLERFQPLRNESSTSQLKLILADLIPDPTGVSNSLAGNAENHLAIIALERHPLIKHDDRLESFARSLPWKVEFGYFLALDDDVIKVSIDDQVIELLKQLGLGDEIISSNMVARRLETVLRRRSDEFTGDTLCDSAVEWMEVNSN